MVVRVRVPGYGYVPISSPAGRQQAALGGGVPYEPGRTTGGGGGTTIPEPEPTPTKEVEKKVGEQELYYTPTFPSLFTEMGKQYVLEAPSWAEETRYKTVLGKQEPRLTTTEKIIGGYEKAESWASSKIAQPLLYDTGIVSKSFVEGEKEYTGLAAAKIKGKKLGEYVEELPGVRPTQDIFRGGISGLEERPLKAGGLFLASTAIPGAAGAVGKVASKVVSPTVTTVAGTGAGVALTGLYGYTTYREIKETEPSKRYEKVGGILTTEILPMWAGTSVGVGLAAKGRGYLRTRGLEYVPEEKLISQELLTGKKTFPTAPQSKHMELFLKSKYKLPKEERLGAWHATDVEWKKVAPTLPGKRTKEIAGTFVAPEPSIAFLRVQPGKVYPISPSLNIFGGVGEPTLVRAYPKRFEWLPSGLRKSYGKKQYGEAWKWSETKAKKGIAYIPGIKSEAEAVIPPATLTTEVGRKYYTKVKGVRVPIPQREVEGLPKIKQQKIKTIKSSRVKPFGETEPVPRSTGVNPIAYGAISYKISKPISKPSYSKVSKISSTISPISSAVSSKISSKIISSEISYPKSSVVSGTSTSLVSLASKPKTSVVEYTKYSHPTKRTETVTEFKFPKFKIESVTKKKREREKGFRPSRYTPSLVAVAMDIKKPTGIWTKGMFSGLEIRPIATNKKSRRI